MEIDLMLALDDENLGRFLRVAEGLGLQPVLPVKLADFSDGAIRRDWIENRHMLAFALRRLQKLGLA